MRKYIFICFLGIFFSCKNQKENEIVDIKRNEKEKVVEVKVKDSLLFDQEGKIIGVSHHFFLTRRKSQIRAIFDVIIYLKLLTNRRKGERAKGQEDERTKKDALFSSLPFDFRSSLPFALQPFYLHGDNFPVLIQGFQFFFDF